MAIFGLLSLATEFCSIAISAGFLNSYYMDFDSSRITSNGRISVVVPHRMGRIWPTPMVSIHRTGVGCPLASSQALVFQHLLSACRRLAFLSIPQLQRASAPVALLGSLVIAFSAYMTMGSSCPLFTQELLVFTALLVGVETALRRGRWLLLVFSVALAGLINPFYLYLAALFLACYVPLRLFARNGWTPGPIFKRCLILAPLAALGVALAATITPLLNVVLNSRAVPARQTISLLGSVPAFALESAPCRRRVAPTL